MSLLAATGLSAQPSGNRQATTVGHRAPPLVAALDADHDGTISAEEIQNAATALATLDKNNDGQLTRDELRPPRPGGQGPPEGSPHARGDKPNADGPPDGDGPQGPPPAGARLPH